MMGVRMLSPFLTGGLLMMLGCGLSVAKAKAPNVSMIKLIQSNYTVVKGASPRIKQPKMKVIRTERLTVT